MVLFTANKPLARAENINAVFSAYDGNKTFVYTNPAIFTPELTSKRYRIRVADEFVTTSPGKCIHIGHGISGGKTYGLDQPRPYYHERYAHLLTYVITTSKDMIPLVAKQCGVPTEKVLPLGMPRTDMYFGTKKGDGKTPYADKRMYLYAPTFRANTETPAPDIDWDYIDSVLTDDEILVVKPHMITRYILKKHYGHIIEAPSDQPSAPYLIDCDVLITDYSSIMFDAHVLEKPVVLFEKLKGYIRTRGMYFHYPEEYASRYCTNEHDLIDVLRDADAPQDVDIKCRNMTAGACDGHSTERVCELIKSLL